MIPPSHAVPYRTPSRWIHYDIARVVQHLVNAKAAILSLRAIPHQRDWVEELQQLQLKMEVAGTSRIEGAEFTENELDVALDPRVRATNLHTRSQKQAHAAAETYRWIATLPDDQPVAEELIKEVHARIVRGCDDDHCPPGRIRRQDENVTFGFPRHRGCEGGPPCQAAFSALVRAVQQEYRHHDPLIQAMAFHYHFAAMHPFLDGNGRTARAIEALMLQRAGLRDTAFIAMSNYYYEEKPAYLAALAEVRSLNHDLTPFLLFGLVGVAQQCDRLFRDIKRHLQKAVFRNMMYDLFHRLESPRKRVIAERQIEILKLLLLDDRMDLPDLNKRVAVAYHKLQNGQKAFYKDLNALLRLRAITAERLETGKWRLAINLDWPSQITESDFMKKVTELPTGKTHRFL